MPQMSDSDVCARFARAFAVASGWRVASGTPTRTGDGIVVSLRFGKRGLASANVIRHRAGRIQSLPVYELAVSDRQFAARDIDQLAADVAHAMTAAIVGAERG